MNVVQNRPVLKVEQDNHDVLHGKHNVNFYNDLPQYELTLDEFEEFALARLMVLRKIEELKVRNVTGDAFRVQLDSTLKAQGFFSFKNIKLDVASHFILRAAYCSTEDKRRWFLTMETHLFRHRVDSLLFDKADSKSSATLKALLRKNKDASLDKLSRQDKHELRNELLAVPPGMSPAEFESTTYYAIPFTEALELVAHRSCLVRGGIAYVPLKKIITTLAAKFRMNLSKSLALAFNAFGQVTQENHRVAPLLQHMHTQNTSKDQYNDVNSSCELTAAMVNSKQSNMPLCMSQLHSGLLQDSKLKHWGRLQYGLFLKGAGMSMEESILFFQSVFTKIMSSEQFHKNYSYNIRHMYGKEGKRASYTPYNCTKIILGQAPATGNEHHGCPFKHYDEKHLASLLLKLKIGTAQDRQAILTQKRLQNYQLACLQHFQVMHPHATADKTLSLDNVANHPNAWFAASVAYQERKTKAIGDGTKTPPQEAVKA